MTITESIPNDAFPRTSSTVCPSCGGSAFEKFLAAGRIHREAVYRERFITERFNRLPVPSELKDLTEFAHGDDATILACSTCGVFVRDEPVRIDQESYAEDPYDRKLMDRLFPRYVEAFRAKREPYSTLLPAGAKVLEVGSHYGAFLKVASEWEWQAVGIDIGKDTARYAKSKGYLVFEKELEDCSFPAGIFDGLFVWNCFEQVPNPRPLLTEIRRVLKPGGLLVVRTPNAVFYKLCENLVRDSGLFDEHDSVAAFALKAMGYNNLLAFPYLYGYSSTNLDRLISAFGFKLEGSLNSELLTLPLPEVPDWVAEEERQVSAKLERMNATAVERTRTVLTGPWMELYYRAE